MALKDVLKKINNSIKSTVSKVTSTVKSVASKVIPTIKDKSSAIIQTVASVTTGNVAGVVSGVASILSPAKTSNNEVKVTEVRATTTKNDNWKTNYNAYTKVLNY